jgi:GTP cyclohydrolase II
VHIGQAGGGERVGDTFKRHLARELEDGPEPPPKRESERLRDYGIGAQILADLGVRRMRLMTNRPRRIVGLEGFDLSVEETVKLNPEPATLRRLAPKS